MVQSDKDTPKTRNTVLGVSLHKFERMESSCSCNAPHATMTSTGKGGGTMKLLIKQRVFSWTDTYDI